MAIKGKEFKFDLYPVDENEYIGTMQFENEERRHTKFIVILVGSTSMNDEIQRLVNEIFPLVMSKLGIPDIHLFADNWDFHIRKGDNALTIPLSDNTKMASAIRNAAKMISTNVSRELYRVLVIINGNIQDPIETDNEISNLIAKRVDYCIYSNPINLQAVRLLTSENQPDTRAVAGLLQIDKTTISKVIDIHNTDSNEEIAESIAGLFQTDNFERSKWLHFCSNIISKFPWDYHDAVIHILPGLNVFWLKAVPVHEISIFDMNDSIVKVIKHEQLTLPEFQDLMKTKLSNIVNQIKVLKVVGTAEANQTVQDILQYFEKTEDKLANGCSTSANRKISNYLNGIANEKIVFADPQQIVDYLRNSPTTKEVQKEVDPEYLSKKWEKQEADDRKREQEKAAKGKQEAEEYMARERRVSTITGSAIRFYKNLLKPLALATLKIAKPLISMAANKMRKFIAADIDANPTQTVYIINESVPAIHIFKEEIIPKIMGTKLCNEKSQSVHLVTFDTGETSVVPKLQSLLQTLDTNKRIQIVALIDGEVQDRQDIENFAEILGKFFNDSSLSVDLQILRFKSKIQERNKYNIFDIDANESNEFIALRICEILNPRSTRMKKQLRIDKSVSVKLSDSTSVAAGNVNDEQSKVPSDMKIDRRYRNSDSMDDVVETITVVTILFFLLLFIYSILFRNY